MFNISFNFDETTKKISNVKIEEVKTKELLKEGSFVSVLDSKLQLTADAVKLLEAEVGDRIAVNYYTVSNTETFPVIGKADAFTDSEGGNKLTKTNTVSFRGEQRKMLLEYGSEFKVVPFKQKMFKLEAIKQNDSDNENVNQAKSDLTHFAESVNFTGSTVNDDLPF